MEYRKFGLTLSVFLVGLFGILFPLFKGNPFPLEPFIIGGILAVLALFTPSLLRYIYTPWMKLGHCLGWINTRIILGLIFFLLITPLGWIMRRFGYNPMTRGYEPSAKSYRRITPEKPIQHMEKPYSC